MNSLHKNAWFSRFDGRDFSYLSQWMSLLPALCGFVYAPFMKTFSCSFTPMFVCTPFMETELHAALKCSFIHLSGGLVNLLQLYVLLQTCHGDCWTLPTTCQFPVQLFIHTIEQSSHKSTRDAHCNFRKTHGPVEIFPPVPPHVPYGLRGLPSRLWQ
jgi:hypothetical protein